jgi:hypothetical protein
VAIAIGALLALGLLFGGAHAEPKKKAEAKAAPVSGDKASAGTEGKPGEKKEKTYTFGGLDIDGRLKTPQLLYFLNRMKSEFDTTTPDKRSFIPELKRSTDEM